MPTSFLSGPALRDEHASVHHFPAVVALAAPVRYEWLELARYWLEGGREPIWFLADARRTDLALVDPASRALMRSYRWPADSESLLGGIQSDQWFIPDEVAGNGDRRRLALRIYAVETRPAPPARASGT